MIERMIPTEAISILLEVGRHPTPEDAVLLLANRLQRYSEINRKHWNVWRQVTGPLPTPDLIALAKGLTVAEVHLKWSGGSVAAVIWVFRELRNRDPRVADELADWILPRTRNPLVPFGRNNLGAKTSEDFHTRTQAKAEYVALRAAEIRSIETLAKQERILRREQRLWAAGHRGSEVRNQFIRALNKQPVINQLIQLADQVHPVEFYPTCLANTASRIVIDELDDAIRVQLTMKLKGRKRGPWKRFKERLRSTKPGLPRDKIMESRGE